MMPPFSLLRSPNDTQHLKFKGSFSSTDSVSQRRHQSASQVVKPLEWVMWVREVCVCELPSMLYPIQGMLSFIRHGCRFLNSRLGCDAVPPSFFLRLLPLSAESCFLTLLYVKSSDSAWGWNDSQVEHRQLHTAFLRLAPLLSYLLRRMLLNWRS